MRRALISAALGAAAVVGSSAPAWAATAAEAAPGATVAPGAETYTAVPGDSFWSVGQRFGVNMYDLAAWNHLDIDSPLDAGWTLQIPPAGWHAASAPVAAARTAEPGATRAATSTARAATHRAARSYGPSGTWACIAAHESGSNPAADTGNGYYGMYQFTIGSWRAAGGAGNPANASAAEQTAVAQRVLAQQGWGAWPQTSRECGV